MCHLTSTSRHFAGDEAFLQDPNAYNDTKNQRLEGRHNGHGQAAGKPTTGHRL